MARPPDIPSLVELVIDVNDRLTAAGIGHAFGGAIALAYYVDEPRATRDMDINISVPVTEAEAVFKTLPAAIRWSRADVRRVENDGQVRVWAGRPRDGIPVDLFFPQHRFHGAVAAGTTERPFARPDYHIPVIGADHLAVFKALFNRPKDWVDIAAMLQAGTLDARVVRRWLTELVGPDHPVVERFEAVLAGTVPIPPGAEMERPAVNWRRLAD